MAESTPATVPSEQQGATPALSSEEVTVTSSDNSSTTTNNTTTNENEVAVKQQEVESPASSPMVTEETPHVVTKPLKFSLDDSGDAITVMEQVLDEIEENPAEEGEEEAPSPVEDRGPLPPLSADTHFSDWQACYDALMDKKPMVGLNMKDIIDVIPFDEFFPALKEYNDEFRSIRRVTLGSNELSKESAQILKEFLARDTVVEDLSLRWNLMKEVGASELSTALLTNRTLTNLELEGNELSDGVAWIAEAIKTNSHSRLKYLGLRQNEINDLGVEALAAAIESAGERCSLTSLDLSINYITPDSIAPLCKVLSNNSSIVHLALNDNNVSIGGPIADLLNNNSTITGLELRNTSLGPDDIKVIVESVYNNASLKKLQLLFNYFDLEAEIACQQLQLDKPEVELVWKEQGASANWRQDEIDYIIEKFGIQRILSVLLKKGNLEPLIENNLLLPNLILTDEEAIGFMDQLLQLLTESLEGLDILLILLDCERTREYAMIHSDGMEMDSPAFETISQLPPIAKALAANIDIVGEILSREERPNSVGEKRIRFAEMLAFLLKMEYPAVIKQHETFKTLTVAWEQILAYPNNNIYHHHLSTAIMAIFEHNDVSLKFATETNILDKLATTIKEQRTKPSSLRAGYVGHLLLILQSIKNRMEVSDELLNAANAVESWRSLLTDDFEDICWEQTWVLSPF
eukprot:TRINITY_DN5833_c0_g1_i1.p1 TRINITY_DN5833_c0_g1~~TRINITY_DN5833_c0_g1_i1.p1  ORF type:complete len:692 (+),score=149.69 TRINITY_DN5833_c0_g1_i1:412-2487(+)